MGFDNIKLEKGLYTTTKGFTAALEELDPSENYKGTPYESLDAYQRQLKRFDIKVSGRGSDTVEKFFSTTDAAALFPEYISRAVRQGMEDCDILSKLTATVTDIDALDYRAVESVSGTDGKKLKEVAEGAFIPETTIQTKESVVALRKRGRMLVSSYEAIRFQHLDLFTITLKQIGRQIALSFADDAIKELKKTGAKTYTLEDEMSFDQLVGIWAKLKPYNMTTLLGSYEAAGKLLGLSQFQDAEAGLNFHATGQMITPLGAELVASGSAELGDSLLALDRTCALEMVKAGGVQTEFDKLIDRQLERAAITATAGFSRIFADAVVCAE